MTELQETIKEVRRKIITLAHASKGPHVASALSCADIITTLYFTKMKLAPWKERDIFILSKAHSAMALYSVLAQRGIIDNKILRQYYVNNGVLPAHLDRFAAEGVEVSAGSLGHGFNMGLGMAYGFKLKKSSRKVYCLIGDGESQEGSIWEGAIFAPKLGLDNFTAIMDYNNLQGYGRAREICQFEPVKEKWESFGWNVFKVDGHNPAQIKQALDADACQKPKMIIASTTKGKGVSFMEDQLIWHYYIVTDEHKQKAMAELK
ncbi:MAG: transketolase [Candidatus Omnitrophica bacterium]|nr:transketolase [Candidatus Omnitrophota bacterium]